MRAMRIGVAALALAMVLDLALKIMDAMRAPGHVVILVFLAIIVLAMILITAIENTAKKFK